MATAHEEQEEEDLVLKVTLNKIHRFMVVIAKKRTISDLKSEITKVSRLLLSSTEKGEITSVQSCCSHELPDIYKVGRLLKEGDSVQAYTAGHVSNNADSLLVEENALTLEKSSQDNYLENLGTQNKSNSMDSSNDFCQENSTKETEDCSSKRNEKEDMDKTNSSCKDSGYRKGKTRLKTQNFEPVTSSDADEECSNKREKKNTTKSTDDRHKSVGSTKEKSSNQVQDLESTLNKTDRQNTNKIDELESTQECNEVQDCEDLRSGDENQSKIQDDKIDGISENGRTKNKSLEVQTTRNESMEERNERTQNEKEYLNNAMNANRNRENPKNKTQNIQKKKTVFQMENFILPSEEGNCDGRGNDSQNEKPRPMEMKSTRKRVFGPQIKSLPTSDSERTKKTHHSKDPVVQEKISRRKQKLSRTESIDKSLADEDPRNRPSESASTSSQPGSIVSEIVLKSQAFKAMLESTGCNSQRRRQAIEKSVTKVATWLVHSDDDGMPLVQRKSTELYDNTPQATPSKQLLLIDKNNKDDTSTSDTFHEDKCRIYPIIDVLEDRVLYYDSDSGSSGGQIKETYLSFCKLVIPKLNPTKSADYLCMSEGHKTTHSVSELIERNLIETTTEKRTEEVPSSAVLCAAGCQDANEEDCGYGSHGVIGSSGSEELFITSPKLKHLMSYTNEPLPSNTDKPLEHDGNGKDDDESCFSTEILDSDKQAHVDRHSSPKKIRLPPDVKGATANETEENEHRHAQTVEKSQELGEKILEENAISQLENKRMISEETIDKSQDLSAKLLEESTYSQLGNAERMISEETIDKGQELGEKLLEDDDTDSQLKNERMISKESVDENHGEKIASRRQDVKNVETTDDLSSVTNAQTEQIGWLSPKKKKKKKKKKKSRETLSYGESMVANGCVGSPVSKSTIKCTNSIETVSQKDDISRPRRPDAVCCDDGRIEESSEQLMSKKRKKKEKRNRMHEMISTVTYEETKASKKDDGDNKQTNEKEMSTNNEELIREKSIQENSAKLSSVRTVIPESSLSTPRKETSVKETRFAATESLVSLPNEVTSAENLSKEKSAKHHKKNSSKNKNLSEETLPGGLQDVIDTGDELQTCSQSTVKTSKDRDQESVIEENSFEKKAEKKKKKKKKKHKERDKTDVSMEETSKGREKQENEKLESNEECNVDKQAKLSSDSREATALCVNEEENCDGKERKRDKKDKKKRRDKIVENEEVVCEQDMTTKKSSKRSRKEESEATNKLVEQVDKPVLKSKGAEDEKVSDICEQDMTTKKSSKRSRKEESEIFHKPVEQVDKPVLKSKGAEDEKVSDICEQDMTTKKSSKTSKRSRKEESEIFRKPVEQVDKPVLKSKGAEDKKVDDICEQDTTTKKSSKRSRKKESEIFSKPVEQVDKPVLKHSEAKNDETGREGERTNVKIKKETKRKETIENNDRNKEKEDSELQEVIPKKKRKKTQKVCEENGKASQKGSCPDPSMFSSGSENESRTPVTNVLSWISKKINTQTTEKSSTKKTKKSTLLDLAQDDQELSIHKKPLHSSTSSFTPRSSSLTSRSRIFHHTPIGFTNTVPRIPKKASLTATTVSSNRRKRKLSNSLPQRRELSQVEKEMLSGGVKRLDELLDNDLVWD